MRSHHPVMFVVTEADATAIRTAYERGGELAAAVEVRRLFPGVTDNAKAPEGARAIAGWTLLPVKSPGMSQPKSPPPRRQGKAF